MTDLLTTPGEFEAMCRQLAARAWDINDLVFNLAPVLLQGDRQLSAPMRPELRLIDGHQAAKRLDMLCIYPG
jgi:hypothetical protein